jgi:hypothetical protein
LTSTIRRKRLLSLIGLQACLVADRFDISAGITVRGASKDLDIDIFREVKFPRVHLKELQTGLVVRKWNLNYSIESPRAPQRLINEVSPVGRGDHIYAISFQYTIDKLKEVIEKIIRVTRVGGRPLLAERIDLIDKDDRWRMLLRSFK